MAAKKIKTDNLIAVELQKFEDKLNQFQSYLEKNSIVTQVTSTNQILLAEEQQDKLHKEILTQIKIQDAILSWLPLLEKLKSDKATQTTETRGDVAIGGAFKKKLDG